MGDWAVWFSPQPPGQPMMPSSMDPTRPGEFPALPGVGSGQDAEAAGWVGPYDAVGIGGPFGGDGNYI